MEENPKHLKFEKYSNNNKKKTKKFLPILILWDDIRVKF